MASVGLARQQRPSRDERGRRVRSEVCEREVVPESPGPPAFGMLRAGRIVRPVASFDHIDTSSSTVATNRRREVSRCAVPHQVGTGWREL